MPPHGMKFSECPSQVLVTHSHVSLHRIQRDFSGYLVESQELDHCPHSQGVGMSVIGTREEPL